MINNNFNNNNSNNNNRINKIFLFKENALFLAFIQQLTHIVELLFQELWNKINKFILLNKIQAK